MSEFENRMLEPVGPPIKRIYAIADIHIRLRARHVEYRECFKKLYDYLKKEKDKHGIIVIAGDIVHSKTNLSPECCQLVSEFFDNLRNIMPTFVILGNHDINLSNTGHMDALSPLIEGPMIHNEKLYLLKNSGEYHYRNIIFGVTSILDGNDIFKAKNIKNYDNKYLIGLYHGTINGGTYQNGVKCISSNYVQASDFDGYDYVIAGDIHKHQYINEFIMYPGSLIQQNKGESLRYHGVIKLDLENDKTDLYEIPNEYGYAVIQVTKGKIIKEDKNIPKNAIITVILTDTDENEEIIKNIETKYKRKVEKKIINTKLDKQKEKVNKLLENNVAMIDKIKNYIKQKFKNVTEKNIKDIVEYHKKTVEEYEESKTEVVLNGKQINLKKLMFTNMFPYGEHNIIEFKNKVYGLLGDNGIGKSSIIEILSFALFGECINVEEAKDILNVNAKNFACQVEFTLDNYKYIIVRTGKRTKSSITTCASIGREDADGEFENLNEASKPETEKIIRRYVGTLKDFLSTHVMMQFITDSFLEKTPDKRIQYLKQLLNLGMFDALHKLCKTSLNNVRTNIKNYENSINKLMSDFSGKIKNDRVQFEDDFKNKIKILLKQYNKINNEIETLEEEQDELEKKNREINKSLKKVDTIDKTESDIEEELEKVEEHMNSFMKQKKMRLSEKKIIEKKIVDFDEEEYDDLSEKKDKLVARQEAMTTKITNINNDIHVANEKTIKWYDKLKKIHMAINTDIEKLHKSRSILDDLGDLDNQTKGKKEYDDKIRELKTKNIILTAQIKDYKKKLNKHKNYKYDPKCKFCVINSHHVEINQIKKLLPKKINAVESNSEKILDLTDKCKDLESLSDDVRLRNKTEVSIAVLEDKVNNNLLQLVSLEESVDDSSLISCMESVRDIVPKIKLINSQLCELKTSKDSQNKLLTIENKLLNINNVIQSDKTKKEKLENDLRILEDSEKYRKQSKIVENNTSKIDKIKTRLAVLNKTYRALRDELRDIKDMKDRYESLSDDLQQALYREKIRYIYSQIVGSKGLPLLLLREMLPRVESAVNDMIRDYLGIYISMSYAHKTTKKTINVNKPSSSDKIVVYVHPIKNHKLTGKNNTPITHHARSSSGFQKTIINVGIRAACSKLTVLPRANVFILDETFAYADSNHSESIDDVFRFLRTYFNNVIVISHDLTIKGAVDEIINIKHLPSGKASVNNTRSKILFNPII
jgi:DNA repair exonuclease SbcCD ATPase subunit